MSSSDPDMQIPGISVSANKEFNVRGRLPENYSRQTASLLKLFIQLLFSLFIYAVVRRFFCDVNIMGMRFF